MINGIFFSEKKHPIISSIWEKIQTNILNRKEGNIMRVTGPSIFTEIINNHQVNEIEWADAKEYISPHNKLEHKKPENHWSKVQHKLDSLYENK